MRACLLTFALSLSILLSSCRDDVLLDERFNDTRLINWKVNDEPETIEGPSNWRVEQDGWLHHRSNIWGRRGDFLGRWHGTMIVAGDESWSDYTLTLKAKPEDDDGFGVIFRMKDAEHFYRLLFIEDGMNGGPLTRLDKREGADYTELWSAENGYRPGEIILIQIEVKGDEIRGYVNGSRLFDIKDGTNNRGKVGLFCFAQNGQAFDDVKVSRR